MPKKIVVFGGGGFVGKTIMMEAEKSGLNCVSITRNDVDFASSDCTAYVKSAVNNGDVVLLAAAKAPAKDFDDVCENIRLLSNIIEGLRERSPSYVLNVSSDAVFGDPDEAITERSEMSSQSAHGVMHCMREKMIEQRLTCPVGHIRPTLIFGEDDPHNGYGPNSFIRKAKQGENIQLFGGGEEQRDHVFIGDVARIAVRMIETEFAGDINAVTGEVISFNDIAEAVLKASGQGVSIIRRDRNGPMPHNGFRAFDNTKARELMGTFQFKSLRTYIEESFGNNA